MKAGNGSFEKKEVIAVSGENSGLGVGGVLIG